MCYVGAMSANHDAFLDALSRWTLEAAAPDSELYRKAEALAAEVSARRVASCITTEEARTYLKSLGFRIAFANSCSNYWFHPTAYRTASGQPQWVLLPAYDVDGEADETTLAEFVKIVRQPGHTRVDTLRVIREAALAEAVATARAAAPRGA